MHWETHGVDFRFQSISSSCYSMKGYSPYTYIIQHFYWKSNHLSTGFPWSPSKFSMFFFKLRRPCWVDLPRLGWCWVVFVFFQWGHMRNILTYIYHKHQPNLDKYNISYMDPFGLCFSLPPWNIHKIYHYNVVRVWDTHWIHNTRGGSKSLAVWTDCCVFFWFCCGVSIENSSVWMGWTIN